MIEQNPSIPASDDRLLAGLSHLLGFIVALIVWATQKDRSSYVRFQAVQAMAFDFVATSMAILLAGCVFLASFAIIFLGTGGMAVASDQGSISPDASGPLFALMFSLPFFLPCLIILILGAILVARLVAAIQTMQGKDFRYPVLGRWVEKYLAK